MDAGFLLLGIACCVATYILGFLAWHAIADWWERRKS